MNRSNFHVALLCTAAFVLMAQAPSASAVNITLTTPIAPGDYIAMAEDATTGRTHGLHIRPSALPAGGVGTILSSHQTAAATENGFFVGDFNVKTGDYFYISGDNGTNQGHELRVIRAGQTTSTLLIPSLAVAGVSTSDFRDVAVDTSGNVYTINANAQLLKFTSLGGDLYNSGAVILGAGLSAPGAGGSLEITNDDRFLVFADAVTGPLRSINLTTNTVVTSLANGNGIDRVEDIAIDYTNGLDINGNLRLYATNINDLDGADPETRRFVTELAFNPTTGVITNPFAPASGNLTGIAADTRAALGASSIPDHVAFDLNGNLIAFVRSNVNPDIKAFSQTLLDSVTVTPLNYATQGVSVFNESARNITAVRDLDIAPTPVTVPEPTTGLLSLAGLAMLAGRVRRSRA